MSNVVSGILLVTFLALPNMTTSAVLGVTFSIVVLWQYLLRFSFGICMGGNKQHME